MAKKETIKTIAIVILSILLIALFLLFFATEQLYTECKFDYHLNYNILLNEFDKCDSEYKLYHKAYYNLLEDYLNITG